MKDKIELVAKAYTAIRMVGKICPTSSLFKNYHRSKKHMLLAHFQKVGIVY